MQQRLLFKLDQGPHSRGLRCHTSGLFLGPHALLRRDDDGNFEARGESDLRQAFSDIYGDETEWESRIRSVKLVASALNKGEMARAMMTAVLMRLPDPDGSIRISDVDGTLAKAGFNPDEPRDERGRWTTGGESGIIGHGDDRYTAGVQLADAGMSDASDDPVAQAAVRAADAEARHSSRSGGSRDKPAAHSRSWESFFSDVFAEIGRAEISESNANRAAIDAGAKAIAEGYDAYGRFMERPIGGTVPITPDFPIWGYGDSARLAPERPIVVGDAVDTAANVLSIVPFAGSARVASKIPELAAVEREAFIILPTELPKNFDTTWPVGRYVIPTDALPGTAPYGNNVERQIGDMFQEALPDVKLILKPAPLNGVDIGVPKESASEFGFQFAEIKPLSASGYNRFRNQVRRWNLAEPVQLFTYDYDGNIYLGFPR